MKIYTADEVDALVSGLQQQIKELKEERATVWIDQEEAEELTGRSYSWFYQNRLRGELPIAMMPRAEGSRRIKYSKADCIAYGREHRILPPATLALTA